LRWLKQRNTSVRALSRFVEARDDEPMQAAVQTRGGWKMEERWAIKCSGWSPTVLAGGNDLSTTLRTGNAAHCSGPSDPPEAVETGNGNRPEQLMPEQGTRRRGTVGLGGD
jgi:hypothetical protein